MLIIFRNNFFGASCKTFFSCLKIIPKSSYDARRDYFLTITSTHLILFKYSLLTPACLCKEKYCEAKIQGGGRESACAMLPALHALLLTARVFLVSLASLCSTRYITTSLYSRLHLHLSCTFHSFILYP